MASSELDGTRAPLLPDQLSTFYKLVNKKVIADVLCRHARAVDLAAQASVDAAALFGGDSLVVADLHLSGSGNLASLVDDVSEAEQQALKHRLWALLLSAIPILVRRLEANTLLPGTIREEELDYAEQMLAVARKAKNEPDVPLAVLREAVSAMGYDMLFCVVYIGLNHVNNVAWPATERRSVEAFVLRALDVVPRTAGMRAGLAPREADVVVLMEQ